MNATLILKACAMAVFLSTALVGGELTLPVKVTAGGEPIDVARTGHSAPWLGDFNGDGKNDLLLGEFFEGRCRVYLNQGTNTEPAFKDFVWFEAGADLGRVPGG